MNRAAISDETRERTQLAGLSDAASTLRAAIAAMRDLVADDAISALDDAALIDQLQEFRRLRAVTAAAEARAMTAFSASQQSAAAERGVVRRDRRKGIADQIALAAGISPHTAANRLVLAERLCTELPLTFQRLASGTAGESAAYAVARESVCLMPEQAAVLDAKVAPRLRTRTGARAAASIARAEAARLDPESVTARIRIAEQQRCVSVRPAPDAMAYLTALLPVRSAVAAYAALDRFATTARATGDEAARSRGQLMADELFTRLTGAADPGCIPVEIQLVMPATALDSPTDNAEADYAPDDSQTIVHLGDHPGRIGDHPIPPQVCRDIALDPRDEAARFIRRIFTDPVSGEVREVDGRRRLFSGAARRAIIARDQQCRQCSAPIRHVDHVTAYAVGGGTTMSNSQALCERCNHTKELPGWRSRAMTIDGHHVVVTTTPTGHRYTSLAPPPLLTSPDQHAPPGRPTAIEAALRSRQPGD